MVQRPIGQIVNLRAEISQRRRGDLRAEKLRELRPFVVDDVLDIEASTATLGKTAGKDAQHNKPTYVSLLGVAESKKMAGELRADALAALEGFGARALRLRELADFTDYFFICSGTNPRQVQAICDEALAKEPTQKARVYLLNLQFFPITGDAP